MKQFLLGAALAALSLLPAVLPGVAAEASDPIGQDQYKACGLAVDTSRQRPLAAWNPLISEYSKRHYGEATWQLMPKAIVLHYTAGSSFPWNLVSSKDFAGETPGLAVHYVVEGEKVWQLLPSNVRSRGAYGINHRAINIELVALHAADLAKKPETLQTAARLTLCLMRHHAVPDEKVYSHEDVSKMDKARVPEVLDLLHPEPYHKIDPGESNMRTIRALIDKLRVKS